MGVNSNRLLVNGILTRNRQRQRKYNPYTARKEAQQRQDARGEQQQEYSSEFLLNYSNTTGYCFYRT